jgi:hypothetical protein
MKPAAAWILVLCAACRDLSGFTTAGDSFEGPVVQGDFVRAGIPASARACLTLDADHFQDAPGFLSTSDGRFHAAALRPIPQLWHDPLSTLAFGEGRLKNFLYVATTSSAFGDGSADDVFAVVSLMHSGDVEVRLLRGAPAIAMDGAASGPSPSNLFAVFALSRQKTPCSY